MNQIKHNIRKGGEFKEYSICLEQILPKDMSKHTHKKILSRKVKRKYNIYLKTSFQKNIQLKLYYIFQAFLA